ncbi:MAG: DUF1080 domain-containing protein [Planctomycetota bacterium]
MRFHVLALLLVCFITGCSDDQQSSDNSSLEQQNAQGDDQTGESSDQSSDGGLAVQQQTAGGEEEESGGAGDTETNGDDSESGATNDEATNDDATNAPEDISLFDGTFAGWEEGVFGSSDECCIEDGNIVLEIGYPMSGVATLREDLPTSNYEIELEAMKMVGNDFFCALTFPVDESHCSFVCGGWGGATTGLSCIDGNDASDNDTKTFRNYEDERWYTIKVRVTAGRIECWIDEEQVVNLERGDHEIGIRMECNACKPLGIASFETRAAFRNITLRQLAETE